MVRLSATILASSPISFTESIEVDIAAEDISAEFGKCTIIHLHFVSSHFFCISIIFSDCLSQPHLGHLNVISPCSHRD